MQNPVSIVLYEDVNDAHRLSVDPVIRSRTGKKKYVASVNTVGSSK